MNNRHISNNNYLKSSTLIEVVVAMIMITVFTGIFFNFITKIRHENNIELKVKAQIIINNEIDSAFNGMPFRDTLEIRPPIKIVRKKEINKYNDIDLLTYKVFNNTGKLLVSKQIFIKSEK